MVLTLCDDGVQTLRAADDWILSADLADGFRRGR
jgi:hypothetical protein